MRPVPYDVAVVIPALNEAESLPVVLRALPNVGRVVVADNGSTDGTGEIALQHGAEVVFAPRRGYGSALLAAIQHLREAPPRVLVILDADGSDRPSLLPRLVIPILADQADLVLSDRSQTSAPGALTLPQRFGNAVATTVMGAVSGHYYSDMGPFRAIRWSSLVRLGMRDPTWGWNVEMQLKAVRHGLRILEIAVPYASRHAGRSKISGDLRGVLRAGTRILWAVKEYRRDRPADRVAGTAEPR